MSNFTIVTDCDGILTTPFFTYNVAGKAEKHFYVNDSITMRQLRDHHKDIISQIIILTGDEGPGFNVVSKRVDDLALGDFVKLKRCPNVRKYEWLRSQHLAAKASGGSFDYFYFGDDLPDAEIFNGVGSDGCCAVGTTDSAPLCLQRMICQLNERGYTARVVPSAGAFTNLVEEILKLSFNRSLLDIYGKKD